MFSLTEKTNHFLLRSKHIQVLIKKSYNCFFLNFCLQMNGFASSILNRLQDIVGTNSQGATSLSGRFHNGNSPLFGGASNVTNPQVCF